MATASNTNAILSAAAQAGAVGDDCTWISLWTAVTSGTFLQRVAISNNPAALQLGQQIRIAASGITLTATPANGETEAMAKRGLEGRLDGGVWVQFHDGDPGANGTSNVIPVARAAWADNNVTYA